MFDNFKKGRETLQARNFDGTRRRFVVSKSTNLRINFLGAKIRVTQQPPPALPSKRESGGEEARQGRTWVRSAKYVTVVKWHKGVCVINASEVSLPKEGRASS